MRSKFPFSFLSTTLLCFGLAAGTQAQTTPAEETAPPCAIDLSNAIGTLADAQVSAANGDQTEARAMIAAVQLQLTEIETRCTEADEPIQLSQTFTAPDDIFAFQYPEGWELGQFTAGLDWNDELANMSVEETIPPGAKVVVSSDAVDYLLGGASARPVSGVQVIVSVGSALHILQSINIYNDVMGFQYVNDGFTMDTLSNHLLVPLREFSQNGPPAWTSVDSTRPTYAIDMLNTGFPIYVLLVQLDEEQGSYALIIGSAEQERHAELPFWTLAIAETVDITP